MPRVDAFVGLGSNLDDPERQIRVALGRLAELPATRLTGVSGLYRNPPMGPPDQPYYVNAVARMATGLHPLDFLEALQAIERRHGRRRGEGERWGPRVLDLDLLLWGRQRLELDGLTVPHPGLPSRAFVLYPLADLAPDLEVPGGGTVADLLAAVDGSVLVRLPDDGP